MTALDLSAIVDHVARAHYERVNPMAAVLAWDDLPAISRHLDREAVLPLLTDAAPLIEAAVREAVAQEVADYADAIADLVDSPNGARLAFEKVASIISGAEAGDPR